jgi:N-glycosylase/DNA lyase
MQELVAKINEVKNSDVSTIVEQRIKEFEQVNDLFNELCFCLMTANFQAQKCIALQEEIDRGFHNWEEEKLRRFLKERGHRFWPQRAKHIVNARTHKPILKDLMKKDSKEARKWLAENVDGLGFKEASHFLRNCGKKDVAIIDFHIIDLLNNEGLISFDRRGRSLTPKVYLEIEGFLEGLAKKLGLDLARLDLYLWYIETGKVLK